MDASGFAYLAGEALTTFPASASAFQPSPKSPRNLFIAKLNSAGTAIMYGTYLGGSGLDAVDGIAIDGSGNAFVTGSTTSADFPTTPGALRTQPSTSFVTKLNSDGSEAVYSTYIAGSIKAIAVDSAGDAYLTGSAFGNVFPSAPGAVQPCDNCFTNLVVAELNPQGTALLYATYLGGNGPDSSLAIAVGPAGAMLISGTTDSLNFPTSDGSSLKSTMGGLPVPGFFVAALNNVPGPLLNYNCIVNAATFSWTPVALGEWSRFSVRASGRRTVLPPYSIPRVA